VAACVCVLAGLSALPGGDAQALDILGLFGLGAKPPAPSPTTYPYDLTIEAPGAPRDVRQAVEDASNLARLKTEAPGAADQLVRIAQADLPRITDALWGMGYYSASVVIEVAGAPLALGALRPEAAARAAEAYRGRALVPVRIVAQAGPQYRFRRIVVLDDASGLPFSPDELPQRVVKLQPGDPARSADVIAAEARIVDHFREKSHPFAKVVSRAPVVIHPEQAMDVTLRVRPGPTAGFGAITLSGAEGVDHAVVRSFIYTEPGDPYSVTAINGVRKSVGRIEALGSVRIREAERLDANGNLPIFVELTERKQHALGVSALYSTTDGPEVRSYWTHRNLFGGGEVLRIEGSTFYAGRALGEPARNRDEKRLVSSDIGGRFGFTFLKPGLWGTRNDLLVSALAAREKGYAYTDRRAGGEIDLRHRFSDVSSAQIGVRAERGRTSDALGNIDYTLVGVPVSFTYDSTDKPLDPSRGVRFTASVTPYPTFLGSTVGMTIAKATASAYYALDEDARYILAARLGLGSILGADLEDIPSNYRFYAGGGGSVRGYRYQSLSPQVGRFPIGGQSLVEGSVEALIKVTDTIGVVPFVDAGQAYAERYPRLNQPLRVAAGLGLRYYTSIGPIRLDVATPLNKQKGDKPVSLYISIGQSF
jgi:translocation and assembly module TamA